MKKKTDAFSKIMTEYESKDKTDKANNFKTKVKEVKEQMETLPSETKSTTKESDIELSNSWIETEHILVYNPYGLAKENQIKWILSFDLDDTVIKTKSGETFAKNFNDWQFFYEDFYGSIEAFAKSHKKDLASMRFVIFSNQSGLSNGKTNPESFKKKIELIFSASSKFANPSFPAICCFSKGKSYYRKPCTGMLEYTITRFFPNVNHKHSYYIGDAAGRPKTTSRKKDFSDSDYKFAINAEMPFMTPEEFYFGEKQKLPNQKRLKVDEISEEEISSRKQKLVEWAKTKNVIVFVGSPASGKSTFFDTFLSKMYKRVNTDDLKSLSKVQSAFISFLGSGENVAVDNTNNSIEKRKYYISEAKKHSYKIYCVYLNYEKEVVFHLNTLRENMSTLDSSFTFSKAVPSIAIHTWFKGLEKPNLNEGFDDILTVNFKAGPFSSDIQKKFFYYHQSS